MGLYLTALAMAREGGSPTDRIGSVPSGPGTHIGEYLRSEVLDPLDPDERQFLLRTSVLDELTAGACDAVLERRDSATVLATPAPAQPAGRQARGRGQVPLPPSARRAAGHGPRGRRPDPGAGAPSACRPLVRGAGRPGRRRSPCQAGRRSAAARRARVVGHRGLSGIRSTGPPPRLARRPVGSGRGLGPLALAGDGVVGGADRRPRPDATLAAHVAEARRSGLA